MPTKNKSNHSTSRKIKVYSILVNGSFVQNSVGGTALQAIQLFTRNNNIQIGPSMHVGQCGQNMQYCVKQGNGLYPCGLKAKCPKKTVVNSTVGNIIAVEAV